MECPRCRFRQPEEEYCARCGVHIASARSRRQRKTLTALVVTVFLLAGAAAGVSLWWNERVRTASSDGDPGSDSRPSIPRIEPPPPPPALPKAARTARPAPPDSDKKGPKDSKPTPPPGEPPSQGTSVAPAPDSLSAPSESAAPSGGSDPEAQIRRWAAQEWVAKAREQSENPEQELSFYRKALEVDPHFAPAFYYMGLLYWGAGNRDACLGAFRSFWEEATAEEKETLLLPVDVSLSDLALPEATASER